MVGVGLYLAFVPPGRAGVAQRPDQVARRSPARLAPPTTMSNGSSARSPRCVRDDRRPGRAPRPAWGLAVPRGLEQRHRAVPPGRAAHRSAVRPVAGDPYRRAGSLDGGGSSAVVADLGSARRRGRRSRPTSSGSADRGPRRAARRARPGRSVSPKLANSSSIGPPSPAPKMTRPPDSESRVATCRASCSGRRRATGVTSVPRRSRDVASAAAVSSIHGSPNGWPRARCLVVYDVIPDEQRVPARLPRPPSRPSPPCGRRRSRRSWGC